jgi:hypothetical protein
VPYYLAPYIGTGADDNRFRPRQSDAQTGWSAIDLRPDPSVASGPSNVCLLWLPNAVVDGALKKVAESPDERVSQADCDQINAFLGTSVVPGPFSQIVGEIMLNPPPAKWKPLQPTRGRNIVFLNGKIYDQPTIGGGSTWGYDNFKRPDAVTWGAHWVPYNSGGPNFVGAIANQRARGSASGSQGECSFTDLIPSSADCFAQVRVKTWNAGAGADSTMTAMVRGSAGPTRDFYAQQAIRDLGSWDGSDLVKRVAGAFTILAENLVQAYAAGDWIQIEVEGSSVQGLRSNSDGVFRQVVTGPTTDTSHTLAGRAGMRVGNLLTPADTEADAFLCGNGRCPKIFLFTTPSTPGGPEENLRVDDFNRTEAPLADISPVTGLARWSRPSTQPVFPDDDTNPSVDFGLDGANVFKHCQFGIGKGTYRLDYLYGPEAQVGYEIVEVPGPQDGQFAAILRISNPGTNSISGYFVEMPRIRDHAPTNDEWRLWRIDPGAPYTRTQLGSSVFAPNVSIGDWLCAQAYKTKIRAWHRSGLFGPWVLVAEATDSTYSGPGYAGLYLNGQGTGAPPEDQQARIDNCFIGTRRFILSH